MTDRPYGRSFWWTYVANTALMVAVSLLFRYADFITALGGTEKHLGMIVGIGMLGAIAARCFQGIAIDRYGPVSIWVVSLALLIVCLLFHLTVDTTHGPWIYLLRILYTICLAGAFGASITFISLQAPPNRMAEMIGMLGSSGFVGMAIGPAIGDWLLAGADISRAQTVHKMFLCAAGAATVSLICTCLATSRRKPTSELDHESSASLPDKSQAFGNSIVRIWNLIRTYHPGPTLLVGVAMGIGFGVPSTFLRAFAAERGFDGLRGFFLTYACVAFVVRICSRRLADRWGNAPTIVLGLSCLGASLFAYLLVTSQATLVIPAALAGVAHAFLFPATVAEGSQAFPSRYRGLATNLTLTMFDIGLLIGQPAIGWTVELTRLWGGDGYPVTFFSLATLMLSVAVFYGARRLGRRPNSITLQSEDLPATDYESSSDESSTEDGPAPELSTMAN